MNMKISDFKIGMHFFTHKGEWICTDIGTRTIIAIPYHEITISVMDGNKNIVFQTVTPDSDISWWKGPPYAIAEYVFDEDSLNGCSINKFD